MKLVSLYIIFALVATGANLISQELVIQVYIGSQALILSILMGTFVGLFVKYILDKKYIFQFESNGKDVKAFMLYSVMGIVTTLIFWGTELAFHMIFETKSMRYIGAVIGLSFGYVIKYYLDKKYVFVNSIS